jgi:hypothetical protein
MFDVPDESLLVIKSADTQKDILELIKDETVLFILYKKKRILHTKIIKDYIKEYGEDNLPFIIKRATENQTLYFTNADKV